MATAERKRPVKELLKAFLLLFSVLSLLLVGMLAVLYRLQIENHVQRIAAEERHALELQQAIVRNHFAALLSDLRFLVNQDVLHHYLEQPNSANLAAVQKEYLSYVRNKRIYDQVRYLDSGGQEVLRINYNDGLPEVESKELLQKKSHRYYFAETYRLAQGQVYISPLDLNVERNEVELPFKPMIRFGMPVFDRYGQKRGILLLNYLGEHLFDLIDEVGAVAHGQTMLLNADGYWLKHPDADYEWGFMVKGRSHLNFAKQHPAVWEQLQGRPAGQLQSGDGLYTFTSLQPLAGVANVLNAAENYSWKMVTLISPRTFAAYSQNLLRKLVLAGVVGLLLAGGLAWALACAGRRRKMGQEQLSGMAHYDGLTKLPNRTLFSDRVNQAMETAKRYGRQCALLYIELDGVKDGREIYGEPAGDTLLVEVAQRMNRCCRNADTLARLGENEFALLLGEITSIEGVRVCVEKMLDLLADPFELKQGQAVVGASIGIALFPAHGTSLEALLNNADRARAVSKSHGKNTYTFAEG